MLTRLGANRLKTLTSKDAHCLVPQKSTAATSSLAPSSRLKDFNRRCSFESGWSAGSIPTPMQTLWRCDSVCVCVQSSQCNVHSVSIHVL